jgi:hypothetical protein
METILARAGQFIWSNARLVERQRFAFHFGNGSREAVLAALLAYRNADGGFGNGLEPDIRCPDSQPVPVQHAFEILDEIGLDSKLVTGACDFLQSVTTADGGVPWLLPTALDYPRAPWWQTAPDPPAAINPTAAIAGLLHKHGIDHPWLAGATAFCWERISAIGADEMHDLGVAITFLQYVPDRPRAERELARIAGMLLDSGMVAAVDAEGYVRTALDWAPTPDHPLRPFMPPDAIAARLDRVVGMQQADGGWPVPFPPFSPGCEQEWRGWITLDTLRMLQANRVW